MQRRQRYVQKSVIHVQSCCFANLNLYRIIGVLVDIAVVVAMLSFEIPRRRRRQKRSLKSDFAIYGTLARLSQLGHYVLCRRTLLELNSYKKYIQVYKKSKRDSSSYVHVVDKT